MANNKYILKILMVLLISMLVLSHASAKPNISDPHNNKTNNADLTITVDQSDSVNFSVGTWDEDINVQWNWFVNGSSQSGDNYSYFIYDFGSSDKEIEVNLKNKTTNQTSDPITWTVTVQPPPPPEPSITDWNNNITNNKSTSFQINVSDSVEFNATANQTITTWNWYVDSSKQGTTADTFIYKFDAGVTTTIKVNATNSNGTSNTKSWSVSVIDSDPPANITDLTNESGTTWIWWKWTNPTTDFDHTEVYLDGEWKVNRSLNQSYNATSLSPKTSHTISLRAVDAAGNKGEWKNDTASTETEKPVLNRDLPDKSTLDTGIETMIFSVKLSNQAANVTWSGAKEQTNESEVDEIIYLNFTPTQKGNYTISVSATNENGTSNTISWNWEVRPSTYETGNRIWDGERYPDDFSKTYTWTPQSFSGFYYDPKDGIGNENIEIELSSRSHGTVAKNHIVYSTSPQEVEFDHEGWGKYQVIGFMADKYFAGYKNHSISEATDSFDDISAIGQGQLHKVLYDDDTKRTISVGGTLALKDGYVLKATDIDLNGRTMFLRLLKDGSEVDSNMLRGGETYVYRKRVGNVDDLPLILVRFDGVFAGTELQTAFLKGIFQISEDVTKVSSGNKFGVMEITEVNKDKIVMKNNDNDVGLNKGSTVELMGDLKIIVADNDDLRFALSVDRKGSFEVRSTVYDEDMSNPIMEWTPYNFGMNIGKTIIGFYYNLDDGLGSETLSLNKLDGRSIPEGDLVYTTEPQEVLFAHDEWKRYQAIGFMADKYFAGYKGHEISGAVDKFGDVSAMGQGQLHKVLIDDDTKRTISVGGTIALKEGYVLKATDIDLRGRTMLLVLLKDGEEVDSNMLQGGETYVYKKDVGSVDSLPLILVRFDNVFAGQELQAAFLKGIFQISESATKVKSGDDYGRMEVTEVSKDRIKMENNGDIGLDRDKDDKLMGDIRLRVANSDTLRFYFAVDVTEEMIADQLVIEAPSKIMAGDSINIRVTAGGKAAENASLTLDTDIGTTDKDGYLNYSIPKTLKNGTYTITATKTGFEKATKNIEIEKYVDLRLSLEVPSKANQYEAIKVKVLYNGTAMSGASVMFDNLSIGTSDNNGELNFTLESSGTHTITASKETYISVSRDIDIRAPYSEYQAIDLNITPNPVFTDTEYVVKSNITNVGTKSDTLPVELLINGSAVDNRTITLAPGEIKEINFTRSELLAVNITVGILGQSSLLVVQEEPTNYLLIAALVTGIGAVAIYVLTSKGLLNLELLKQKFNLLFKK